MQDVEIADDAGRVITINGSFVADYGFLLLPKLFRGSKRFPLFPLPFILFSILALRIRLEVSFLTPTKPTSSTVSPFLPFAGIR